MDFLMENMGQVEESSFMASKEPPVESHYMALF
jgi:hypothetical protein